MPTRPTRARPPNWSAAAASGLLRADLPEVQAGQWHFRQLFVDGQRQVRARYPNFDPADPYRGGFLYVHRAMGGFGVGVGNIHNAGDRIDYLLDVPADGDYAAWVRYGAHNEPFGRTDMAGRTVFILDDGEPVPAAGRPRAGRGRPCSTSPAAATA